MSEDKELVHFVTEMHRSIDGKTYYGIRPQDRPLPESASETTPSSVTGEGQVSPSKRRSSCRKNETGFHQSADECLRAEPSQSTRHKFRNHCSVEVQISLPTLSEQNRTSSFPYSTQQHPADSYSAGRTESVSGHACDQSGCVVHDGPAGDEKRHECGSFPSPTDAELRQHGCPALVEPRARTFLCQLPDSDLAAINAGVIPAPLMKMLGRVAYDELERRRETDDA